MFPKPAKEVSVQGTWKLVSGTVVEKGKSTTTQYTGDKSFIKVINATHFAFMGHDLSKGKDSATAMYSSGGGTYQLKGDQYTEHLEYCNAREWEGHDFTFTLRVTKDSLIQTGVEKIENLGIERLNVEKYVRY
ncbi:hypothetical protein FPE01S_01_04430 [Flavihumibacter petaseus NBRC 106054]|uniref:Uncharacterized protein n=1 Tax=Flavihumibacter petaseus NBRC 106054 TaxID=1220578 RepID=A0A0E9MVJ4_9BACT|nr:hypothetical protein FPE01S_01_04430 [Flavihumibacter petaseus NBRC 106054]